MNFTKNEKICIHLIISSGYLLHNITMAHQDWEQVIINTSKLTPQKRSGPVAPTGNKQFRNLDSDEPDAPQTVSKSISIKIREARVSKGLTQKKLAQSANLREQVVKDYESGKVIPNAQELAKLRRALGVNL